MARITVSVDEKKRTFTITGEIPTDVTVSASGKSLLLASTRGTMPTEAKFQGQDVDLNLNLTIPNPNRPAPVKKGEGE